MRDPDRLVYFREEVGGLLMGGYEREPAAWGLDGGPPRFTPPPPAPRRGGLGAADGAGGLPRPRHRQGRGDQAHQWSRGVHARRRVHPRGGAGREGVLRGRRLLRPRHRRGGGGGAGGGGGGGRGGGRAWPRGG